jgi:hypothetical protein
MNLYTLLIADNTMGRFTRFQIRTPYFGKLFLGHAVDVFRTSWLRVTPCCKESVYLQFQALRDWVLFTVPQIPDV